MNVFQCPFFLLKRSVYCKTICVLVLISKIEIKVGWNALLIECTTKVSNASGRAVSISSGLRNQWWIMNSLDQVLTVQQQPDNSLNTG